jgi:dTDP-4-dehydrorhamnose 3,5-epimerase
MKFTQLPLSGSYLIDLEKRTDARGFFARCFCEQEFSARGLEAHWVQVNASLSIEAGTLRGMHFQRSPHAETKMVRCVRGSIWDVIVDVRKGSPTFGRWAAVELDEDNRRMIYIPQGFAHGFQTLRPNTELLYFHSREYSQLHEGGLHYGDPSVNINWPIPVSKISDADRGHPTLAEVEPISV